MTGLMPRRRAVVKLGGNPMDDPAVLTQAAAEIRLLHRSGVEVIVVHGGGPHINRRLVAAGLQGSPVVRGLRVTPIEALPHVHAALVEDVQGPLVRLLNEFDEVATGLDAEGAVTFRVDPFRPVVDGIVFDYQRVGVIRHVDTAAVEGTLRERRIPVLTGYGYGDGGARDGYNINADLAAGHLAAALGSDVLVVFSDVKGVYGDFPNRSGFRDRLTVAQAEGELQNLDGGMRPKVEACCAAVKGGVRRAQMMDASDLHRLAEVVDGSNEFGTEVVPDESGKVAGPVVAVDDGELRHAQGGSVAR